MNVSSTSTRSDQKPSVRWSVFISQQIECILSNEPWNFVFLHHLLSLPIIQSFQIAFEQIQWSIVFLVHHVFIIVFQLHSYFVPFVIFAHFQFRILQTSVYRFPIPYIVSIETWIRNVLDDNWSHGTFIVFLELVYILYTLIIQPSDSVFELLGDLQHIYSLIILVLVPISQLEI